MAQKLHIKFSENSDNFRRIYMLLNFDKCFILSYALGFKS